VFATHLKKVVDNVDGGIGALIMGLDGIAVDTYVRDGEKVDLNTIGMEFSFILTQVRKAGDILKLGGIREIAIKAEQLVIVIRMLTDEYFIAVALGAGGNFGKARFLLRLVAPKMLEEL
jgi:predicted regulator of Ras-like GTPase activity (Roadblock/LC7/MglB family)